MAVQRRLSILSRQTRHFENPKERLWFTVHALPEVGVWRDRRSYPRNRLMFGELHPSGMSHVTLRGTLPKGRGTLPKGRGTLPKGRDMLPKGQKRRTKVWDKSVGQKCGTKVSDKSVGQKCRTKVSDKVPDKV
jgi:hypothetical protein